MNCVSEKETKEKRKTQTKKATEKIDGLRVASWEDFVVTSFQHLRLLPSSAPGISNSSSTSTLYNNLAIEAFNSPRRLAQPDLKDSKPDVILLLLMISLIISSPQIIFYICHRLPGTNIFLFINIENPPSLSNVRQMSFLQPPVPRSVAFLTSCVYANINLEVIGSFTTSGS
jgi:hypothetical protein